MKPVERLNLDINILVAGRPAGLAAEALMNALAQTLVFLCVDRENFLRVAEQTAQDIIRVGLANWDVVQAHKANPSGEWGNA